jgi:hypothetical protein
MKYSELQNRVLRKISEKGEGGSNKRLEKITQEEPS